MTTRSERIERAAKYGDPGELEADDVTWLLEQAKANWQEQVRDEFQVHMLNELGIAKATELAREFSRLLERVEGIVSPVPPTAGARELALVRTKLQEASFFAKRAMAMQPDHQR